MRLKVVARFLSHPSLHSLDNPIIPGISDGMSINIQCDLVDDRLDRYHPYTNAYRHAGSTRYRDFSDIDPRDPHALNSFGKEMMQQWRGDRQALALAVSDALSGMQAPAASLENAGLLGQPDSVAIVAGHQPALFGGPLFLVLKIMSVIRLCALLNDLDGPRYVPVYWNGSEDHNQSEFGRVTILDPAHDLLHLGLPPDKVRRMAAKTPVREVDALLNELAGLLPRTEFLDNLVAELSSCIQGSLGQMQSRLMLQWFGADGLVVVEPWMLRRMARPVIVEALMRHSMIHDRLGDDSRFMRSLGFPPPLPLHGQERTLVYYVHDTGERERIRRKHGTGFVLEKSERYFPDDTVYAELRDHPERFSPAAALRPAVQAAVLPVVAYVAGGGELAYHFQLRGLFKELGVRMPVLVPRAAATILKPALVKTMKRIGLATASLLRDGWEWERLVASAQVRENNLDGAFTGFADEFTELVRGLSTRLAARGVSGLRELERERDRFLGRMQGLKKRFMSQDPLLGDKARQQYFRLRKFVLPAEGLQELSVWTVYFLALFGPELLPAMQCMIDPLTPDHHVFRIA